MKKSIIALVFCSFSSIGLAQSVEEQAHRISAQELGADCPSPYHGPKSTASFPFSTSKTSDNPYPNIKGLNKRIGASRQSQNTTEKLDSLKRRIDIMVKLDSVSGYTKVCGDWFAIVKKNDKYEEYEYFRIAVWNGKFSVRVKQNRLDKLKGSLSDFKHYECKGIWLGKDSLSWTIDKGYQYKNKKVPDIYMQEVKLSTYSQQIDNYEAVLVDSVLKCTRKTEILYYDDYGALLWNEEKTPIRFTCRRMKNENGQIIERW